MKAHAKLTLTLRMMDRREDGFNNLRACTVFLSDLYDDLVLEPSSSRLVVQDGTNLGEEKDNLILRAVEAYAQWSGSRSGAELFPGEGFVVTKRIPVAAGLGGGSADAAAALRITNERVSLASLPELSDVGAEVGSDVPACVYSRAVWMSGRGEHIEQMSDQEREVLADYSVVVVTPPAECPTPRVFARYEEMGRPHDEGCFAPGALASVIPTLHNDLSIASYDLFPELGELRDELARITVLPWMMAGSGSTLFCVETHDRIRDAYIQIPDEIRHQLRVCTQSALI